MRSRKEIEDESSSSDYDISMNLQLILEVLLDIREEI